MSEGLTQFNMDTRMMDEDDVIGTAQLEELDWGKLYSSLSQLKMQFKQFSILCRLGGAMIKPHSGNVSLNEVDPSVCSV